MSTSTHECPVCGADGETMQVSADGITSGGAVLPTRAWIDVYVKQNIALNNDDGGPYAVHANAGVTEGDFGGLITIKAELGKFVATGATGTSPSFVVQANAAQQSGHGGNVTIQAGANVELNASTVQAKGPATDANRTGGTIAGRSFNGSLLGNAPGCWMPTRGAGDRRDHPDRVRGGELHGHDTAADRHCDGCLQWKSRAVDGGLERAGGAGAGL